MTINLPPIDIQATDRQWTGKEICAVYDNAIELTTQALDFEIENIPSPPKERGLGVR